MPERLDTRQIIAASGDPARGAADLARFEEAYARTLGRGLSWDAPSARSLLAIFGNSRALAERLIANPSWAEEIIRSPYASKRKPKQTMARELAAVIRDIEPADDDTLRQILRRFKYREMIRLVGRDLAGTIDPKEMLAEWSDVADALIEAAYSYLHQALSTRYGTPLNKEDIPCTGVVMALGKLGAQELNLSSDIDLIIIYATDEGGCQAPDGAGITNHQFYTRLTVELTRALSTVTPEGFVFRVDHELRPEGPQGALANSLPAAERYYQYFGQDWERQALIRARPVAGDMLLGSQFVEALRPFVYRRSISISDLSHMRDMKEKMEHKAASSHDVFDIKLGTGGIREIEFLVQALQQLYGGAHSSLRRANTFEAIDALRHESVIHPYAARLLIMAYSFLRRLENMLQAKDDLQTHRLPTDEAGLIQLARSMGYHDQEPDNATQKLNAELARHTGGIMRLFRALFEADYDLMELEEAIRDNLTRSANEEEEADSLAWFKQQESRRIQHLDLEGRISLPVTLKKLSAVADVVVKCAWEMARNRLVTRHGQPKHKGGGHAGFAVVGMGKLGSQEIDYGSDLDLCFLYAGSGTTDGPKPISNVEFFTKMAQRIISTITLPTRYGKAFQVDSELRPSGQSGTLVTSLESFSHYHTSAAQVWERVALLRARPIAGDEAFLKEVGIALNSLAYKLPPPPADVIRTEIDRLRMRSVNERAKEGGDIYNIKIGQGGLSDLESVVALHHLCVAHHRPTLWRRNTFEVIDTLMNEDIIDEATHQALLNHLIFYRQLMSRLRLFTGRSTDSIDLRAPYIAALAEQMDFATPSALREELEKRRKEVGEIYSKAILGETQRI